MKIKRLGKVENKITLDAFMARKLELTFEDGPQHITNVFILFTKTDNPFLTTCHGSNW